MARKTRGQGLLSQRQTTWLWIIIATGLVVGMLYWEQIALLYVLATLSVTVLLLVVAFADLSDARKSATGLVPIVEPLAMEGAAPAVQPVTRSTFGAKPRKRRG